MAFRSSGNAFGAQNSSQSAPSTFGQSSAGQPQAQNGAVQIVLGNNLEDKETEKIGFLGLAGEAKIRLFQDPYNSNSLPIPSSSLLSVAQNRGLIAAAGPSGLVLSQTSALRQTFAQATDPSIIIYRPNLALPVPLQISHVAFTADEKYLLLGAAVGGIAVYLVDDLVSQGSNAKSAFELGCPPLREMHPIPITEKPELVCILTGGEWGQPGDVSMVNLNTRQIQTGLKNGVTTVSWSPKGKQIVCGGIGGGLCWITPEGQTKAEVGPVPNVSNCFISSLLWIETHIFYITYTPLPSHNSHDSETTHYILTRTAQGLHTFNKIQDTAQPYGMSSRPTYYNFLHLKTWAPALKDLLVVTSTSSADIGVVTRWDNNDFNSSPIAMDSRRATLPMSAASMDTTPIGLALDLSPSREERIKNPVVGFSGMDESVSPCPVVYVLNNEGLLCAYWLIYSDAVIAKEAGVYPGLIAYAGMQQPVTPAKPQTSAFGPQSGAFGSTPAQPAFGQSAFGQPSQLGGGAFGRAPSLGQPAPQGNAFGSPSTPQGAFGSASATPTFGRPTFGSAPQPAFGQPAFGSSSQMGSNAGAFGSPAPSQPAFGQSNFGTPSALGKPQTSAFGTPSALGGGQPAFGATSAHGKPQTSAFGVPSALGGQQAFGSPSPMGGNAQPAFGSTSSLGMSGGAFGSAFGKPSPGGGGQPAFGHQAFGQVSKLGGSAFGQASPLGAKPAESAFGSSTQGASGGFGRFAQSGGFLAAATQAPAASPFGSGGNAFETKNQEPDAFAAAKAPVPTFGTPAATNSFQIPSAFQQSATPADNGKADGDSGSFGIFGQALKSTLEKPSTPIKEETMEESDEEEEQKPRSGVTGGNMFNVAPAPDSIKSPPANAFGTGIFGTALKSQGSTTSAFGTATTPTTTPQKNAFASPLMSPTAAPTNSFVAFSNAQTQGTGAFGSTPTTTPQKPGFAAFGSTPPVGGAFGGPSAPATGGAFGKGIFGTALQNAQTSALGQADKAAEPVKSAFGPTKPAEGDKSKDTEAAASKALPDDSDAEDDLGEVAAGDAPLPPDFTADRTEKSGWGASKMTLPREEKQPPPSKIPVVKSTFSQPVKATEAKSTVEPVKAAEKKEPVKEDARSPPDFTTDRSAEAGWGAGKMPLPGDKNPETPGGLFSKIRKPEKEAASGGHFARTGVDEKDAKAGGLFSTPKETPGPSAKPESTPSFFSKVGLDTTSTLPTSASRLQNKTPTSAGRSRSGFRPTGRAAKKTPEKAKLTPNSSTDIPEGFSIFGSPDFQKSHAANAATSSGTGSIFNSVPKKDVDIQNLFANLKAPNLESDSGEDEDNGEYSDEYEDEEDEEEEVADHQEEYSNSSGGIHGEEAEWVEDQDGNESPVEVKYPSDHETKATATRGVVFAEPIEQLPTKRDPSPVKSGPSKEDAAKAEAAKRDEVKKLLEQRKKQAAEREEAEKRRIAEEKAAEQKRIADEKAAEQKRVADEKAAEQKRIAHEKAAEQKRVADEKEAERKWIAEQERRAAEEKEAARREEERQKTEQEREAICKEEEYRLTLQKPFEPSEELVEFLPVVTGGPYTILSGFGGIMEMLFITTSRAMDTLGANLRNLEAYNSYHAAYQPRGMADIDNPDAEWKMSNLEDMGRVVMRFLAIVKAVQKATVKDKLSQEAVDLVGKIDNLILRSRDIPNILILHTHPKLIEQFKAKPLSPQQRLQRSNLRRNLPELRKLLTEVEKEFTVLQAKIASTNHKYQSAWGSLKPPTHDVVRQTIVKLTRTAKDKAERLDLLEDGLRKLKLRSASPAMSKVNTKSPSMSRARSRSAFSKTPSPNRNRRAEREKKHTPIKEEPESETDDEMASLFKVPLVSSFDGNRSPQRRDGQTSAARLVRELEDQELRERLGTARQKKWGGPEEYRDEKQFRREAGKRMRAAMKSVGVREV